MVSATDESTTEKGLGGGAWWSFEISLLDSPPIRDRLVLNVSTHLKGQSLQSKVRWVIRQILKWKYGWIFVLCSFEIWCFEDRLAAPNHYLLSEMKIIFLELCFILNGLVKLI